MVQGWILIFIALFACALVKCELDIDPCSLKDDIITCEGLNVNELEVEKVMNKLRNELTDERKHFKSLTLRATDMKEIKEKVFEGLTFDDISLLFNKNLKRIDSNAFVSTKTKAITILDAPALEQTAQSFFEVLSKMVDIESIYIDYGVNITEIPANAFKPLNGFQNKLKSFHLMRCPVKKIGARAFYYLNALNDINFFKTDLVEIEDNSFEFEKESEESLNISFRANYKLKPNSFSVHSLSETRRPTLVLLPEHLADYDFQYIDQNIFLPFLLANESNKIIQYNQSLDCKDCRNVWLKKYMKRVIANCYYGNKLDDPANFPNCNELF